MAFGELSNWIVLNANVWWRFCKRETVIMTVNLWILWIFDYFSWFFRNLAILHELLWTLMNLTNFVQFSRFSFNLTSFVQWFSLILTTFVQCSRISINFGCAWFFWLKKHIRLHNLTPRITLCLAWLSSALQYLLSLVWS